MAKSKSKGNRLPTSYPMPAKETKENRDSERKYRAEDALRTIQKAEECKGDKSLMKDVKRLADRQMNALKKI